MVRPWLARRVLTPIAGQLRQGITPEKIALTIAIGAAIGVFPLLGTTTALCFAIATALRLNHPVIQLVNYLVYPLQIALLYVFVRFGEWLFNARRVSFRAGELVGAFATDPTAFLERFAVTGLHGIVGWMMATVPAAVVVYVVLLPLLRKVASPPQRARGETC